MLTKEQESKLYQALDLIRSVRIDLIPYDDDECRDNEDEQQLGEIENDLDTFIYDWGRGHDD